MRFSQKSAIPFLAGLAVLVLASTLTAQTSPEKFLGHRVGADRKLADYSQIKPISRSSTQNRRA